MFTNKPILVVYFCNPSYVEDIGRRIAVLGWSWAKTWEPIWKITKAKRTWGIDQVIECLPSNHEDLSSRGSSVTLLACSLMSSEKNACFHVTYFHYPGVFAHTFFQCPACSDGSKMVLNIVRRLPSFFKGAFILSTWVFYWYSDWFLLWVIQEEAMWKLFPFYDLDLDVM
jgi:hypothetical protein